MSDYTAELTAVRALINQVIKLGATSGWVRTENHNPLEHLIIDLIEMHLTDQSMHGASSLPTAYDGDVLQGISGSGWARLAKGTEGQIFAVGATSLEWIDNVAAYVGIAADVHSRYEKQEAVGLDEIGIIDSEDNFELKMITLNGLAASIYLLIEGALDASYQPIDANTTTRNYVTPAVTASVLTFDFASKFECFANKTSGGAIVVNENITVAYSNATNFKTLWFTVQVTTSTRTITFPANHISGDTRWAALVLTLPVGTYQVSVMNDGAKYHVVCSQAEV